MSKQDDVLREYWHATARAPREYPGGAYDAGLDILGASRRDAAPTPAKNSVRTAAPSTAPAKQTSIPSRAAPSATAPTREDSLPSSKSSAREERASAIPQRQRSVPVSKEAAAASRVANRVSADRAAQKIAKAAAQQAVSDQLREKASKKAAKASNDAVKTIAAKTRAVAKKLIALGKKFSSKRPQLGNKLQKLGERYSKVTTRVRGDMLGAGDRPFQYGSYNSGSVPNTPLSPNTPSSAPIASFAAAKTAAISQTDNPDLIYAMSSMFAALQASADAGSLANDVSTLTEKMVSLHDQVSAQSGQGTTLFGVYPYDSGYSSPYGGYGADPFATAQPQASSVNLQPLVDTINNGNAIVEAFNSAVDGLLDDPTSEGFDSTYFAENPAQVRADADAVKSQFEAVISQAQAWLASAPQIAQQIAGTVQQQQQQALMSQSFDPGTAGGGGGGSSGDYGEDPFSEDSAAQDPFADEELVPSTSAEVEQFRETGGEYDPFYDEQAFSDAASDYASDYASESEEMEPEVFDQEVESEEMLDEQGEEEGDALSDENEDVYPDDILGIDFKWQYIFAPWQASQDKTAEEDKEKTEGAARREAQAAASRAAAEAVNAEQLTDTILSPAVAAMNTGRAGAAKRKLAEAKRRRAMYEAMRAQEVHDTNSEAVMGSEFDLEDAPDIFLQQYEQQITDEPADPLRSRASVHRGASYLEDEIYPPGGSSSGEEGGIMRPTQKVEVFGAGELNALERHQIRRMERNADESITEEDLEILGQAVSQAELAAGRAELSGRWREGNLQDIEIFGHDSFYGRGLDALGAVKAIAPKAQPRAGFTQRSAGGTKIVALKPRSMRQGSNKQVISNARDVGKHAIATGQRLLNVLKKVKTTKLRGDLLGAIAKKPTVKPSKAIASKRAPMTVNQMKKIANDTIASGKKLVSQADKFDKYVTKIDQKTAAGAKAAASRLKKAAKMKISQQATSGVMQKAGAATSSAATDRAAARAAVTKSAARSTGTRVPMSKATRLTGDDYNYIYDVLDAHTEVLGYALPDPTRPGYLQDGSIDPNYSYGGYGYPYATGGYAADPNNPPDPNRPGYLMNGRPDPAYGVAGPSLSDPMVQQIMMEIAALPDPPTVAPPKDPSTYEHDPRPNDPWLDVTAYSRLPQGAVIFDNKPDIGNSSTGWEGGQSPVGSQNFFLSTNPNSRGGMNSGFAYSGADGWQTYDASSTVAGTKWSGTSDHELVRLNASSMENGWGPIIGNPYTPEYKGLRYIAPGVSKGLDGALLFWFYDTAPQRFKQEDDNKRLQEAITVYQTNLTTLRDQLAAAVIDSQLAEEQRIALQKQQALEDAAQQRQYEQEQAQMQHQAELQAKMDEAAAYQEQLQIENESQAQMRVQEMQDASYARQQEADDASLERMLRIDEEREARQEAHELELARQLDEARARGEEEAPNEEEQMLPEEYAEAAAEEEGGGEAFDEGNVDDYMDSEYVDEEIDETVMGGERKLTAAEKKRLEKYLKKLKETILKGDDEWEQGEGGDDAWELGEGDRWAVDLDGEPSAQFSNPAPRVRAKHRIRARAEERRG